MSNWAKPGVQCVCIKDDWGYLTADGYSIPTRVPMLNEVLTVANVEIAFGGVHLTFEEIPYRQVDGTLSADLLWDAVCFRPLIDRKTDISIFTRMLIDDKTAVHA